MIELAGSTQLRDDMRRVREQRHDPFTVDGEVDLDRVVEFLNEFNAFISHEPRPFRRIVDRDMRL
ncbi:MAG: hypothetical protein RDV41_04610 [Planctomycetota bacterium]|nr:hypothetical protein [Planctomycetota bacterium]